MAKRGLLIVNLGTPDEPTPEAVGRYLRQFLMDPDVISLSAPLRWVLVHWMIVPKRRHLSSELYGRIWTKEGSPLLVHSLRMTEAVQKDLKENWEVRLGMRYGNPSLYAAMEDLQRAGVEEVHVFPQYPQNAGSTWGSTRKEISRVLNGLQWTPNVTWAEPFYDHSGFVDFQVGLLKKTLGETGFQELENGTSKILFSFHGVPESHVKREDPTGAHCLLGSDCCLEITEFNRDCYRAQCFVTARRIAQGLGIKNSQWKLSFQSRLGRTEWIKPYTEEVIKNLATDGCEKLYVSCPSFTTDCLETLEEIAIRTKEQFLEAGGKDLVLVPAPNEDFATFLSTSVNRSV